MTEDVLDDSAVGSQAPKRKARRVDPVSTVAGLIFIAVASTALSDRFWADIDPVIAAGAAIVALGAAMIVVTALRHRR